MRDAGEEVAHRRQLFRLEKLVRALLDLRLQRLVLAAKIAVEKPHLQQVAHAEKQFGLFEGLGHQIACARFERRAFALTRHVGGQDKHREIEIGPPLLELFEDLDAVEVGHAKIEQDQIRLELGTTLEDLAGVGRAS